MIRCIHYSNADGSREGVVFTEDLDVDAFEHIPYGCSLTNDFTIDEDFPSSFPMEFNLERRL